MTEYRDCDIPNDDEELEPEQITISPTSCKFPNTYVWRDSEYQTFTVTNTGSRDFFFKDIITNGDFDIKTVSIPNGLKAGASIDIRVIFSPTKVGNLTGSVIFKTLRGAEATAVLSGTSLKREDTNTSGDGGGSSGGGDTPTTPTAALVNWKESKTNNNSVLTPNGTGSILNAIITPKGAGALAGNIKGDNRGKYSVDLQFNNTKASTVASGDYSSITCGRNNTIKSSYSFIGTGYNNIVTGEYSTINTGTDIDTTGTRVFVGTGERIEINGDDNAVSTASNTTIQGSGNVIGYAYSNQINGNYNVLSTGLNNNITGSNNTLLNGSNNTITGSNNVIVKTSNLNTSLDNSVILYSDSLTLNKGQYLVINKAINTGITSSTNIFLGIVANSSLTDTIYGTILSGVNHSLSGNYVSIISGTANHISSDHSIILSGSMNSINGGEYNIILGGYNNYLENTSNAIVLSKDSSITKSKNLFYINSSTTLTNNSTQNNQILMGAVNGSVEDTSSVSIINSDHIDLLSSYDIYVCNGKHHFISSSSAVSCIQGYGNVAEETKNSTFLNGYKNKFIESNRSIALGGSRNVHMAQNTVSLGSLWGHDLMVSNHVFRALKEGTNFNPVLVDDSDGLPTSDAAGNELADWENNNSLYQSGEVILQSITDTSRGFYTGTQEYKKYFLTHALKYSKDNVWGDLPQMNGNNTFVVPEQCAIFWELKFELINFTQNKALKGTCVNGIITNNSGEISILKQHKLILATESSDNIETSTNNISIEIDKENSRIYFCIPQAWKDYLGGATLSYKLITQETADYYWD